MTARFAMALVALFLCALSVGASRPLDPARAFLVSAFELTPADIARIDAGQVFSRTADAKDKRELANLGAVRVATTAEHIIERVKDVATFKRDEAVLQIGTFADPPQTQNVARLTLDPSDVDQLRDCRAGHCDVQLSTQAIERFRRDVDWRSPDAAAQANGVMREMLVEYVAAYQAGGSMMRYADRAGHLDLTAEFASMVGSGKLGWHPFPQLLRHLTEYPVSPREPVSDFFYWSKEKVGRRPVISVTHLAIARTTGETAAAYAIASKHIYGTHYFDASLGLTVLIPDTSAPSPATFVVYFNRSRVDVFGGVFGGVARKLVNSRARATVATQLGRMQQTMVHESLDSRVR